ncbi:hypothetical protein CEXT_326461 [Caerostris extrusa]|uniref:Uncharacterized protein n=1 Tax=Caerostris extrusa TaxID=172846 RepID=A0AAV4NFF8_CAEEX|nr:hypothetical protein CEXT_326461 [Caerostris extrusa]
MRQAFKHEILPNEDIQAGLWYYGITYGIRYVTMRFYKLTSNRTSAAFLRWPLFQRRGRPHLLLPPLPPKVSGGGAESTLKSQNEWNRGDGLGRRNKKKKRKDCFLFLLYVSSSFGGDSSPDIITSYLAHLLGVGGEGVLGL